MNYSTHNPLYIQIYQQLKQRINQGIYPVGQPIPIEKDLVSEFNVSRITIQKAIKILVEEQLVSRKSGVGTFVLKTEKNPNKQKTIGLIIPGLLQSFGQQLLTEIEKTCSDMGYFLILKISHEDQELESKYTQELLDLPVDGLLIEPVQKKFYNSLLIQKIISGFPIVILDKELIGIDSLLVSTDHYLNALKSANFLLEKNQHKISIIGYANVSNSSLEKRIDAFKTAYLSAHVPFTDNNVSNVVKSSYLKNDDSTVLTKDIEAIKSIIQFQKPTCLVALDSYLADLIRQALFELNLSTPTDISLFGFDSSGTNFSASQYTFLSQNEQAIGSNSVDLLNTYIKNGHVQSKQVLLPAEIKQFGTVKQL